MQNKGLVSLNKMCDCQVLCKHEAYTGCLITRNRVIHNGDEVSVTQEEE